MKKIVLGLVCFTAILCSVLTARADDEGGTGGVVCNPPTTNTCVIISLPIGHKTVMGVATVIVPG
jgi:hypothetical protein